MRAKSMALLMLALGCGLVAAIGITQVLAERNTKPSVPTGETMPIFVAVKDIPLGEPCPPKCSNRSLGPKTRFPSGPYPKSKTWKAGAPGRNYLPANPSWKINCSAKEPSSQGASAVIPKGYRVVSVQVDSVSGRA